MSIDSLDSLNPIRKVPKYYRLANILRSKIEDHEWEPRQAIPAERQLEIVYSTSRITVRKAIDVLVGQGYLYREHGRGTFVSPKKLQKKIVELTSFTEDMQVRGMKPGQIILTLARVIPPKYIRAKLELPSEDSKVIFLERIRLADGKPIGLQISYLNLPPDVKITRKELIKIGSLYTILREKFGIAPTEAEETLEATLASEREAKLLETDTGSPLLFSSRLLFSQDRKPVEFVKVLYRGDRYKYTIRLTR